MATSMDRLTRKPVSVTDWRLQRCKNDAKNIRAFGAHRSNSPLRPKADPLEPRQHSGGARPALPLSIGASSFRAHPDHDGGVIVLCGFIVALYIALGVIGWVFFH